MGDSDDISASAASTGAGSSSPVSSGAEGLRVDFYVLEEAAPAARMKVACRLAEKAYLASQRALIWHTDRTELAALDDLLWTFADGSFVPHEWLTSNAAAVEAPVLLSAGPAPTEAFDFVVNLAPEPPPFLHLTRRVAEIIDGDEGRRRAGRARFKAYRELGVVPATTRL
ncbi:MAG TPA: DNA polymerase III subunit chi [Steroidobacteraceae bacterium]|nr:DNA polymerase III subunit chi [Steroidobacteraceae bacterium]